MTTVSLETTPRGPGGRHMDALVALLASRRRIMVLTGAGCSTESGIPDYRDRHGDWRRVRPIQYQDFVRSAHARRRYWARSMAGWPAVHRAAPAASHRALVRLEAAGVLAGLVTQNVDGLHGKAGSRRVIDLHGRIDAVECLACGERAPRAGVQCVLEALNPDWPTSAPAAPDGDAALGDDDCAGFRVPGCRHCGGTLKPTVVFFGENVPRDRARAAFAWLESADALLVAGSSLMVWSGYRFVRAALARGTPVAVVNLGRTRADGEVPLKVEGVCGEVLETLASALAQAGSPA